MIGRLNAWLDCWLLRFLIWGLGMDIALLEERIARCQEDRLEFLKRRSDLILALIEREADHA